MHPRYDSAWLKSLTFIALLGACSSPSDDGNGSADAGQPGIDALSDCTDSDGDFISDFHEGPDGTDTDGDGTADIADSDSDGDNREDSFEAGDNDPCSTPSDTDSDGIPDFRDTDSDGNGILDSDEQSGDSDGDGIPDIYDLDDDGDSISDVEEIGDPNDPNDTDGDGTPDWRDDDADGDGIPDIVEGSLDWDDDGIPSAADVDSDGDGIPDAIEAGPDPTMPVDADGDGFDDYADPDSDNDGLSDGQEDTNQDGVLDPGESDPTQEDTDMDGFPDVVEWAAGTDPSDPNSVLDADDFFFLLPYESDPNSAILEEGNLDFSTTIIKADVFFEIDTTGSMGGVITTLQDSLQSLIVPNLDAVIDDAAMGVASFRDFPLGGFGSGGDLPFLLGQRITTSITDVQNGLNGLFAAGGSDIPESGLEALYQTVTGEGVAWFSGTVGSVPKFDALEGYDPARGHGLLSGAGFRAGALPIVVHATDAPYHEGEEYIAAGVTEAHTRDDAVAAAQAMGARFIGLITQGQNKEPLKSIARDTGALVSPEAWGPFETQCHTGLLGALEPPDVDGLCPLVFTMGFNGGGVDLQIVEGIESLVRFAALDISGLPVADPNELPMINTARFITAITPVGPPPPGSVISGDVFENVLPGQPVRFTVTAQNTFFPGGRQARLFRVTIRVMGSSVTVLDERDVFIVVPAATFIP